MATEFRLDELLRERDLSQADLARISGVSILRINALRRNRTAMISLTTIDKICGALGCTPGDLFSRPPDPAKRIHK